MKLYKVALFFGITLTVIVILTFWLRYISLPKKQKNLEVDFLDVGQGDAILIQTPYNQNILIDGGPDSTVLRRLGEELSWYDRTIDLMILTHPHDDHVGGLKYVLERYEVRKILYTGVLHSSPAFLAWLELIKNKKIPLVIIDRPQIISFGSDCFFDIIYPKSSLFGKEVQNLNNSSIVGRLVYGKKSFLFSGDAELEIENELLGDEMQSDVYKVGHHGSITSSGQDFLDLIDPDIAVIQVGKDNEFGHPSLRVLKRFKKLGVRVFRNDITGTVRVVGDGESVKVLGY